MKDEYLKSICYLDTNIFVYMHDRDEVYKREISNYLYKSFIQTGMGRISVQVISEWRNVMIRKYNKVFNSEARRKFIILFDVWQPLVINPAIILKADILCDRYNFSPYDAIHIQCAIEQDCRYFLSEDMQDGLVIDNSLTLFDPYRKD